MLAKLLIKNYKDVKNPKVRNAYGILANIVGILFNVALCVMKIVIGTIFHSVAVTADGINNLSDAGSSIISLVGFKMANKPADKDHPFGHARIEYVTALIIAFIVMVLGVQLIVSSVQKIVSGEPSESSILMIAVLALAIIIKFFMFFYYRAVAKKILSPSLKAAAADSLNDVVATTAVLLSAVITYVSGAVVDGYFGILVALFILVSGIKLVKETVSPLLGEKPTNDLVNTLIAKIKGYDRVLGIHDLIIHNYGASRFFASVHVEVDAADDIMLSHEMLDTIEREVQAELAVQLVIHMDPVDLKDPRVVALKEKTIAAVAAVSPEYHIHDFRVVMGVKRKNLIFDVVVPAEETEAEESIRAKIFDLLHGEDATVYTIIQIDRNYIGE